MARKIIWTKRANSNFNHVIAYLEKDWGEKATKNFVLRTYSIIDLLSEQPSLGSLEKEKEQIKGFLITKHNRLFYRFTDKEFIVLNIFDNRSKKMKV